MLLLSMLFDGAPPFTPRPQPLHLHVSPTYGRSGQHGAPKTCVLHLHMSGSPFSVRLSIASPKEAGCLVPFSFWQRGSSRGPFPHTVSNGYSSVPKCNKVHGGYDD